MHFIIFQFRRFLMFLTDSFLFPFKKFRELWADARRGRSLIFGLPALLVAIVGILIAFVALGSQSRFAANYEVAKKRAEKEESWDEAIVYMRKIMQLRPDDNSTKWELARILDLDTREGSAENSNRTARAIRMSLSPEEEPGYPKAHVWRANQYLNITDRRVSDQMKRDRAERQLRFALDTNADNEDALIVLAERILIPKREYGEALSIYQRLFKEYVGYYVKIAELCVVMGKADDARPYIKDAIERYTVLLNEEPGNVDYHRRLANAYAMLGQHDTAAQSLLTAIEKAETPIDRKQLQISLSRIYLARGMMLAQKAVTDAKARTEFLDYVILAYQTDPENDAAKTSLTRFGFSDFEESPRALYAYDPRDNPEDATDVALQVAGTFEIVSGDRLLGIRLLELSIQKNPRNHESLNNLAFTIMDSDIKRALDLSNRACAIQPNAAQYLDTRGNIYMRLGDWEKATNDLETAVKGMDNKLVVYENIVECYRQQNMANEAAVYQKKVDELKAQQGNSNNSTGPND